MTALSIPLDNNLYKKAQERAAKQGQTVVGFISELVNRYLNTNPTWTYAIERDEDNQFVVSDSVVHAYGVGDTLDAAHADYRLMLLDMYENLSENAERLSPRLQRHYKALVHHFDPLNEATTAGG